MRTRHLFAVTAALLLALTGCSSYSVEDCKKAIDDTSTKTNRPKECKDLSQKDHDILLTDWVLKKTLNDMSKEDRDILDYGDDGSVNGSLD